MLISKRWSKAWENQLFRWCFCISLLTLVIIAALIPGFFLEIEERDGTRLNDVLLNFIPGLNCSFLIFFILYGSLLWMLCCIVCHPLTVLIIMHGYIILSVMRLCTLTLFPLNPPAGLIPLNDPILSLFYHSRQITKDLFFSGHTSILCLVSFCQIGKKDKIIGFSVTILMGFLLLFQHIHYTIDILMAPLFSWVSWYMAKRFLEKIVGHEIFAIGQVIQ